MSTKIEYVSESWNPVTGCTPVSEGCAHCYAKRMAQRLRGRFGYPQDDPFAVTLHPDKLDAPLHWKKPRRVFTVSMGDLFHEDVPDEFVDAVFSVMWVAAHHTFLVLTKRPERMLRYIQSRVANSLPLGRAWRDVVRFHDRGLRFSTQGWNWRGYCNLFTKGEMPRSNILLGVTAENQEQVDKRIPVLLETPAAKRWVSIEPCLGAVDLRDLPVNENTYVNAFTGRNRWTGAIMGFGTSTGLHLDWVVLGGESGPGARPLHPDSVRSVRDQCVSAGVPFLFKQWGAWFPRGQWEHSPELVLPDDDVAYQQGPRTHIFPDGTVAHRIGKKRAGRLLDGQLWDQYPA